MRIICPQCRTIYHLDSVDPDAILICHRCGAEFGMGKAPEGAQQVDTQSISDRQTEDLFAGMGFDEVQTDEHSESETAAVEEPTAEAEEPSSPAHKAGEEAGHEVSAEVVEAVADRDFNTEDIGLDELPDDYLERTAKPTEPTGDLSDDHPNDISQTGNDIGPPFIPSREAWQEAESTRQNAVPESSGQEELRGPESVYFEENEPLPPPPRRRARILPWLIIVLLCVFGAGLWMNYSTWMNDPWLRSVLINAGLNLEIRDKDWHIDPASVSAEWIKRENGDAVLIVHGVVHNLLQTDVSPPLIHFTLFDKNNPRLVILQRDLPITRPPLLESIRQSSYVVPLPDNTPVSALGKRDFVLVLENLPKNAGNFTLSPKVR